VAAAAGSLVFADGKLTKAKSRETETNVETVRVRSRFAETLIFSDEFAGYERNAYSFYSWIIEYFLKKFK